MAKTQNWNFELNRHSRVIQATLLLMLVQGVLLFAEPSGPPTAASQIDHTNFVSVERSVAPTGLDAGTTLAIEKMREATEAAAKHHAALLETRLNLIEQQVASQREREFQAMQKSNRTLLIGIAALVTLGLLGTALMGILMFRSVHRLAEMVVQAPPAPRLGAAPHPLIEGREHFIANPSPAVEQSSNRLLAAMGQLERRIGELEHSTAPKLGLGNGRTSSKALPDSAAIIDATTAERVRQLMEKGEAYLTMDQSAAAVQCFEEVVQLFPNHADGHLKRGTALERLERLDEALESLNHAVTLNPTLTTAHLCRGSVLNRLARHDEALQSYEEALRIGRSHD